MHPAQSTGLAALVTIAQAAAHEILAVYATDFAATQKADDTPVTEADLRADRIIRAGLQQHFAGVFVWSEESSADIALPKNPVPERFFLVDPLDGTKEFLKRNGEFTVNIALIEHGVPLAGVVLAPALGELFYAAQGLGAFKVRADGSGARPIRCAPVSQAGHLRVLGSRSHGLGPLDAWLAQLNRPHTFTATGSSLKFCRIAEGAADVYPRFGPTSQWDTAAGQCVLEQAGGKVVDAQGQRLRYGLDLPLLNGDFVAWGDEAEVNLGHRAADKQPKPSPRI